MKPLLLYRDRDLDRQSPLPREETAVERDLALAALIDAMADGDAFRREIARRVLLEATAQVDVATVHYRQDALDDCAAHPAVVQELHDAAVAAIEGEREHFFGIFSRHPGSILYFAVDLLRLYLGLLRRLRGVADQHAGGFTSEAFRGFFALLQREFDDRYLAAFEEQLVLLRFESGVTVSAGLGDRDQGTDFVLHAPDARHHGWLHRLLHDDPADFTVRIAPQDEAGARALGEFRERALNEVANAAAQSADHLLGFFAALRAELAFYLGCLNLRTALEQVGVPTCRPRASAAGTGTHRFTELCDPTLAFALGHAVVGNTLDCGERRVVVVTGANQGGKSSFLRSVGIAQVMMQAGMFVAAAAFDGDACDGVHTHYRREEDPTMEHGKLAEELARFSAVVEKLRPGAMLLMNESFASTNERDGSEIARQAVGALAERRVRVFLVTHLYEFSASLHRRRMADVAFLRAERRPDGSRPFALVEGPPLETSFGEDLYREVFSR